MGLNYSSLEGEKEMKTYEALLSIDGGGIESVPVRVCGFIEDHAFYLESVFIDDLQVKSADRSFVLKSFDIYENLKEDVLRGLEDEAQAQAEWDGEL